ncbi:nuclear transport factor 2 family protein [Actinacidiphila soli]|uniref:nuclear transport factor 2 family protein n=1 Tax=Actinacidiphila soli TaxID=2487275 RepID=UPI000FC9D84E|nr:nuclear transport factor 2 family protein [Actinacidiphila soli]
MSATPREVAESYWRAEESRDIARILSHFHEDAVFHPVSGPLKGHAEIRTFYDGMGDAFPGLEVTITHEISSGDEACLEWEAVLIDHDGVRIPIRGVNVVHVHDGKFASVRAYFDPTQFPTTGGQK